MPIHPLPDRPDLGRMKATAKDLRDLVRAGVDGAVATVREHHPRGAEVTADPAAFRLADAQLTLARHHGFASWPRLKAHVETVRELTRSPHEQPVGGPLATDEDRADELLRLACLTYGADDAARPRAALALLAEHPHLSGLTLHTAAATGAVEAARRHLEAGADVDADGGPFAWAPLLYVAYSRIDDPDEGRDTVGVARLLLDHGADPDAGFLWDGLPSPFTALTGAFGGGEGHQPAHARWHELASLLLDAGADPSDSQTVYDRGLGDVVRDDTGWLELLLDHGFGRGDGGPWVRRLGHEAQSPAEVAAEALAHAAEAGLLERARLLLAHGVDPDRPGCHPAFAGRTPYQGAVEGGNHEIARLLAEAGADTSGVDATMALVGALLAADGRAVAAAGPGAVAEVRATHPDLVARAAERGRPAAIRLLAEEGWDVSHLGRLTALHEAAYRGDRDVVDLLLALGADPTVRDPEHDGTPAGWAHHGGHPDLATDLAAAESTGPDAEGP
ncbi:MAG TPA: ankyrin repeat domain-containing protein [Iamia sp.]